MGSLADHLAYQKKIGPAGNHSNSDADRLVKPESQTVAEQWVVHIVGPDDVIDMPDEIIALRRANQHNKQFVQLMPGETSLNGIYCVAVAKNAAAEEV